MSKSWLSRIIQIVGTLALVALVVIVYRRTDWCKGFTPDGIMTLVAGVLAFAAVQWQIWDQRRTQGKDQERRRRAVATAVLFEIDSVYRSLIQGISEQINTPGSGPLLVKPFDSGFPVFEGNAGSLGELPAQLVQAVVGFYGVIMRHISTLKLYASLATQSQSEVSAIDWKGTASELLESTKTILPALKLSAYTASRALCDFARLEFAAPTIAVASESLGELIRQVNAIEGEITPNP